MSNNSGLILTRLQKDALGELGNIGAGKAGVALSKFLARDVSMSLPNLEIVNEIPIKAFQKQLFDEKEVALIMLSTIQPTTFDLFCVITKESVDKLLKIMFKEPEINTKMVRYRPIYHSLIKEIGSILLMQYISALNKHLRVEHKITYPRAYFGALIDGINKAIKENAITCNTKEKTATVRLKIFTVEENITFDLIIAPCGDTIQKFLKAMHLA